MNLWIDPVPRARAFRASHFHLTVPPKHRFRDSKASPLRERLGLTSMYICISISIYIYINIPHVHVSHASRLRSTLPPTHQSRGLESSSPPRERVTTSEAARNRRHEPVSEECVSVAALRQSAGSSSENWITLQNTMSARR